MLTRDKLHNLTYKKIKTINHLILSEEWEIAAYFMGYVLEFILKASSCKSLRYDCYPPLNSRGNAGTGFKTHEFEQLLIVSGLNDIFGSLSTSPAYNSWSTFTTYFSGNWVEMRYEDMSRKFDKPTVLELRRNLYDGIDSIFQTIKRKRRW